MMIVRQDLAGHPLHAPRSLVEVDGQALAYVEAGAGPPVLLIHGALTNADDMALGPLEALARRRRVLAFDRPGHGASARRRMLDASPWRQAALIHKVASRLGLERPVVVGHSFGGAVALAYGLAYPDAVAGVVALAPIVWPEPRLETFLFGPRALPGAGDLLAAASAPSLDPALLPVLWRSMFLPQTMPERFLADFSFASAGSARTTVATGEDALSAETALWRSVAAYGRLRRPVRILGGDKDLVVNSAMHGAALARFLPDGRFTMLRGLGHMLHHFAVDPIVAAVDEVAA